MEQRNPKFKRDRPCFNSIVGRWFWLRIFEKNWIHLWGDQHHASLVVYVVAVTSHYITSRHCLASAFGTGLSPVSTSQWLGFANLAGKRLRRPVYAHSWKVFTPNASVILAKITAIFPKENLQNVSTMMFIEGFGCQSVTSKFHAHVLRYFQFCELACQC